MAKQVQRYEQRLMQPALNEYDDRATSNTGTGVTAAKKDTPVLVEELTFADVSVTMTDGTTNGSIGTRKLCDLPDANVLILGVHIELDMVAAAGIGATATVKTAVGTAAEATNDTLDSTQANIIGSTDTVLSSSAGEVEVASDGVDFIADGATNALHLNFGVADAGSTANSTLTLNGTVRIAYLNLGTPAD